MWESQESHVRHQPPWYYLSCYSGVKPEYNQPTVGMMYHLGVYYQPFPKRQIIDFQTKRVCRRQFFISWKWQEFPKTGIKHCGKRRSCSLRAISLFLAVFSKDLYCRHVKTRVCLGKGWNPFSKSFLLIFYLSTYGIGIVVKEKRLVFIGFPRCCGSVGGSGFMGC